MARILLLIVLGLTACSKGAEADLPYIGQARSLAAEWALVNGQASQGKLTGTYTQVMRKDLREQLQTTSKSLAQPDSDYGGEIRAILKLPDDASSQQLRALADRLKQIEDKLESA